MSTGSNIEAALPEVIATVENDEAVSRLPDIIAPHPSRAGIPGGGSTSAGRRFDALALGRAGLGSWTAGASAVLWAILTEEGEAGEVRTEATCAFLRTYEDASEAGPRQPAEPE